MWFSGRLFWLSIAAALVTSDPNSCKCCNECAHVEPPSCSNAASSGVQVEIETLSKKDMQERVIGKNIQWLIMCQDHTSVSSSEKFSLVARRMKDVVRLLALDDVDEGLRLGIAECSQDFYDKKTATDKKNKPPALQSLLALFELSPEVMGIVVAGGEKPQPVSAKSFQSAVDLAQLVKNAVKPRIEMLTGSSGSTSHLKAKCTHRMECYLIYSNRTLSKVEEALVIQLKREKRSSHWAYINATTHKLSLEDKLPPSPNGLLDHPRLIAFRSYKAQQSDIDRKVMAKVMRHSFEVDAIRAFVGEIRSINGSFGSGGLSPTLKKRRMTKSKKINEKEKGKKDVKNPRAQSEKSSRKMANKKKGSLTKAPSKAQRAQEKKNKEESLLRERQRRAEMEAEAEDFIPQAVTAEVDEDYINDRDENGEENYENDAGDDTDNTFIDLDEDQNNDETSFGDDE